MATITVTLNDTLQDCVDGAISEVETAITDWLEDNPNFNPDTDELDLGNDLDYDGRIHEIVDGAVPIYTREIETAWFLHGGDLEEAYENAGVGRDSRDNNGMAAIYYYISEKVSEWFYENGENVVSEFFQEKVDIALEEVNDAYRRWWDSTEINDDDIEDLELDDLNCSSDFVWVNEQAENRLKELKASIYQF